ncbi:MAG TPA: hypothetical protein VJG32_12735 [Anaerolineae bacterium]|nr:hypothetical protein [Anaerolineae bacterium]
MKNWGAVIALTLIVFAGALAAAIGSRLSEQAMTILTGAACGAGLTAPLAILTGMYIGSQRATRDRQTTQPQQPIVVVSPPQQQPQPAAPMLPTWSSMSPAMPAPRQYTILGEETVIDGNHDLWQ